MTRYLVAAVGFVCMLGLLGCSRAPEPPKRVAVKGKLLNATGAPAANLVLTFFPDDRASEQKSTFSKNDGSFEVELVPGNYSATLKHIAAHGHLPGSGGVGGGDKVKDGLKVEPFPSKYEEQKSTPFRNVQVPEAGRSDLVLKIEK
jgi:hypothetical protein